MICDRCKREVEGAKNIISFSGRDSGRFYIHVVDIKTAIGDEDGNNIEKGKEICSKCSEEILEIALSILKRYNKRKVQ